MFPKISKKYVEWLWRKHEDLPYLFAIQFVIGEIIDNAPYPEEGDDFEEPSKSSDRPDQHGKIMDSHLFLLLALIGL